MTEPKVTLARRYHPLGHTIYDVYRAGERIGAVTHPDCWHVYEGYSGGESGTARTRVEAVALLLQRLDER